MASLIDRIKSGWNAFTNNNPNQRLPEVYGTTISSSAYNSRRRSYNSEGSIVGAIYNKIAIDVASIDIRHVKNDEQGRYESGIPSNFDEVLSLRSNLDQSALAFKIDMVLSLCINGVIAVIPVDTVGGDPRESKSFDIRSLRVGEIIEWFPRHVRVRAYNDHTGQREELVLPKETVAIVENPLASVMNSPNSILQRLIRKLQILDVIDEQSGSGKLDIIIQLPYTVRSDKQENRAERRRKGLEKQLSNSKYGIAYADATERITQLNRPAENNLMNQITYLTNMVHSQLGLSEEILNGTADEQTLLNYMNSTVEPIIEAITQEFNYKFLSKTARTQGQCVSYHHDPFKLIPINNISEIADKFTRNEILTSNEIRGIIGYKPVNDPKADQLINANLSQPADEVQPKPEPEPRSEENTTEISEGDRRDEA